MRLICAVCAAAFAAAGADSGRLQTAQPDQAAQAAFARQENVNQLGCELTVRKPAMEIDLRYHTGFSVTLPMKKLSGSGGAIRTLLRVRPAATSDRPVFFSMITPAPPISPDSSGDLELRGDYAVGPGRYTVDWQLSYGDAVCRKSWQMEAKLGRPFTRVPLAMPPGAISELPPDPFDQPGEAAPRAPHSLHVKVLVNFSPAGVDSTIMDTEDVRVITDILRAVSRETRFGRFSVVAFSSDQERVVRRLPPQSSIDFHSLGSAVRELSTGVVSFDQIQDKQSRGRFLEELLSEELRPDQPAADAIVLISPKLSFEERMPERALAQAASPKRPVFLLSYNPQVIVDPWQGGLARAIKKSYRGLEFTISGPQDLGKALLGMRSKLAQSR
jgi:hypothetical protein